jgi:hypothetical protein
MVQVACAVSIEWGCSKIAGLHSCEPAEASEGR